MRVITHERDPGGSFAALATVEVAVHRKRRVASNLAERESGKVDEEACDSTIASTVTNSA